MPIDRLRAAGSRGGGGRLWRDLLQLVASWWRYDSIRVPASEGAWLRLPVGSLVEKDEETFEIVDREILGTDEEPLVGYRCVAGSRSCRLLVTPGPTTADWMSDVGGWSVPAADSRLVLKLSWEDKNGRHSIDESDLTVWPGADATVRRRMQGKDE